jgi:hypothetical protein
LFPLGAKAIAQSGEIGDALFVGDRFEVIDRQAVGIVQQPADQRALAVVD